MRKTLLMLCHAAQGGQVTAVYVKQGDYVKKGAVIIKA